MKNNANSKRRHGGNKPPIVYAVAKNTGQQKPVEPDLEVVTVEGVIKKYIFVLDTNIAVYRPKIIDEAREDGNILVIPWTTLFELNTLKNREFVGFDAREAIRLIDKAVDDGDTNLIIETAMDYVFRAGTSTDNPSLDKKNPDHQIIACVNAVLKKKTQKDSVYNGYQKIKFLSNDSVVRIMAKTLFRAKNIAVEPLLKDRIKKFKKTVIRSLTLVSSKDIKFQDSEFSIPYRSTYRMKENEAVIFLSKYDLNKRIDLEESKARFLGIRKGSKVRLVNPGAKVSNLAPLSNGKVNWPQVAAINVLLDPAIHAAFLQGPAGTGKTLLALAAGLEMKHNGEVKNIIVGRVTEPIDRSQSIGLLPGGVEAKMAPWVLPIIQNLSILRPSHTVTPKNGYDESNVSIIEGAGISIQPLDFIRGTTFRDTLIIIEEAQNLTPHQIKTLITRAGEGSKMIFTGDLSQIEEGVKLDVNSSGLTYAISRMGGQDIIGIVNFDDVVRSRLARLAEKLL